MFGASASNSTTVITIPAKGSITVKVIFPSSFLLLVFELGFFLI
jgi:hypothetical protein